MIEADHHPNLHVDFGKFRPKLSSYFISTLAPIPAISTYSAIFPLSLAAI